MADQPAETTPATFLQDDQGNQSCMRLMCCTSLVAAILFGAVVVVGKGGPDGVMLVLSFLVAAFAPKAVSKMTEGHLASKNGAP